MAMPFSFPRFKAFVQGTNAPLSGGLLYVYYAGTSTPATTYTDAGLGTAQANPVVLDSNGEAEIWLNPLVNYKFILKNSVGTTQWSIDNVSGTATVSNSYSTVGHNLLMNGSFEVWQAGTSFAGNNGAAPGCFLADGWAHQVAAGGGAVTDYTLSRQASGRSQSQYCMRVQRNAAAVATRNVYLVQNIETLDSIPAQGQYLSFSCFLRSGANAGFAAVTAAVYAGTGTDESWQTAASITGGTPFVCFNISPPSTTWTQYIQQGTVLGPIPTGTTQLVVVFTVFWTGGTAGAADYLEIDDVKLELGGVATNFEWEDWQTTLRRAQRRYYKNFQYAVTPAQNVGFANGALWVPQIVGAGVANQVANVALPIWMRDSVGGTCTTYNPVAANAQMRNTTVGADCAATTIASVAGNNMQLAYTTAAGSAAGNQQAVFITIDRRF